MKQTLILIGGGGHCKACIDVVEAEGKYRIAGIADVAQKLGAPVLDYCVTAGDGDLEKLVAEGHSFLVTVGHLGAATVRHELFQTLMRLQAPLATVVAPTALVSRHAHVGLGTIVMHGAIINAGAVVGNNAIINTNALVEHDALVAHQAHVSTGAVLNGACVLEEGSFLGSNAVVVQGKRIGRGVVVGAGAVVASDILEEGVYAGNPAKRLKA